MLRFTNYNIVFQEIPDEVTLAINLSNCPNRCEGCHSPYLREDIGDVLNEETLSKIIDKYQSAITCVCFMGGDAAPQNVEKLAYFLHHKTNGRIKTGWYSGKDTLPTTCSLQHFDYLKLGAYTKHLGGLNATTTNQRFYQIKNGEMIDITSRFQGRSTFDTQKSTPIR